jgi:hypothetical protein
MTDFDQSNGPTLEDLVNNKKFKLAVLAGLFIAVTLIMLDNAGYFGQWG